MVWFCCFGLFVAFQPSVYDIELTGYPTDLFTMDDYSIWNFVSIFFGLIFYGKLQRKFSRFVLGHAVVAAPREDVFMQCSSQNSSISVNSMRMLEPCPSGASRQRTLSEFLEPRPRESVLETQLEDSVLVMPNGQDPWPEAQQLSSITVLNIGDSVTLLNP